LCVVDNLLLLLPITPSPITITEIIIIITMIIIIWRIRIIPVDSANVSLVIRATGQTLSPAPVTSTSHNCSFCLCYERKWRRRRRRRWRRRWRRRKKKPDETAMYSYSTSMPCYLVHTPFSLAFIRPIIPHLMPYTNPFKLGNYWSIASVKRPFICSYPNPSIHFENNFPFPAAFNGLINNSIAVH